MKNINKKIIIPIMVFIFLISAIIIKISLPSYALEEQNNECNHNETSIEEAYIIDDNGRVDFGNKANLSVETSGANQYNVKLLLSFNSDKKEVEITLKDGIKWIGWDTEKNAPGIVKSVTSQEYKTYEAKNKQYTIQSGTKVFEIKDDVVCASLNFIIAPDMPLRVEEIKDAIIVEQKNVEANNNTKKMLDLNIDYSKVPIVTSGYTKTVNGSTLEGEKNYISGNRLVGVNVNFQAATMIYKNFEVEVETPLNVEFIEYNFGASGYGSLAHEKNWENYEKKTVGDKNIYKFIYKNYYGEYVGINPVWDFSKTNAKNGDNILINVKSLKYQLYDEKEIIYIFNDSACVEEDTQTRKIICSTDTFGQNYTIINYESIAVNNSTVITDFNKNYPNEIIRLGNFSISNSGATSKAKIVNLKFDTEKIGVTQVSLPAVLGTRIIDFKYKLVGDNTFRESFDEVDFKDPHPMFDTYSNSIGYVNFSTDMINSDKFIAEVEYNIGKIPLNSRTVYPEGVFSYSGILKKQSDGTYPNEYVSNITVRNTDNTSLITGTSKTTVDNINYLSICPDTINSTQVILAGSNMKLGYIIKPCSYTYHSITTTNREPIIYIRLPKSITINNDSIIINSYHYNQELNQERERIKEFNVEKLNNNENNIYKITFEKGNPLLFLGYPKYALYKKIFSYLTLNFDIEIPKFYSDNGEKHYYYDTVFLTDGSIDENISGYKVSSIVGSTKDKYDVDGDGKTTDLMTYDNISSDYFQIKTNTDINSYISIKTEEEETDEIVIIKDSTTINSKIVNNSGIDNQKGEVYIPIPRKDQYWKGLMYCDENNDCTEYSYNLYLEELIKENDKYKIYYGKNIKPINEYNDLKNIEKWYNNTELKNLTKEELKEINLIKIEVPDIDNNEEINVEFKLYSDEKNTKDLKYNDLTSVYYRNLKNAEGDVLTGWKKTNYINIALGLSEEIIETPITSSEISVIVMIFAIPMMIYGMYLIWQSVKEHKDKMDK